MPIFWRQRYVIALCAVLGLGAGVAYLLTATKVYTSTARMKVTPAASRLTGEAQSFSDATAGNYLYTEREVLASPSVLALTAQLPQVKTYLADVPDPIGYLEDNVNVDVDKRGAILWVSFSSTDRKEAADIPNAIVKAYQQYQTKPKASDEAELTRLADERKHLDEEIGDKNKQMQALEQKYGVLTSANNGDTLVERRLNNLSTELNTAHLETLKAQSELEEAKKTVAAAVQKDKSLAEAADAALPLGPDQEQLIRTEMLQLQARLQDLRQHYRPAHPVLQTLQHRINELNIIYATAIERRYLITKKREEDLQATVDKLQQQAVELNQQTARYVRLQADIDAKRKVEEQIDSRRRQIQLDRDLGMLTIDPFDPATIDFHPSPHGKRTLPLAMLLGLVAGCGLGYLRDWRDDRFRTTEEIKESVGLPVLGMVPQMPAGVSVSVAGQKALLDPSSDIAEACRTVRTQIYFGAPKDQKTLLVTSPAPGDGKSTLASNLAITMAQAGKRVLLVDADLRLPSQHTIFNAHNRAGLSNVLDGQVTLDQAIQTTHLENLELLPCGPKPRNPSEMLNSTMFGELLEVLSERYDQVVIDSPPVMGVADARIIAASCDVTVLVLRAKKSTRRMSELARDGLQSVGARLLGLVVNDVSVGSEAAYGHYGYGRPVRRPAVPIGLEVAPPHANEVSPYKG